MRMTFTALGLLLSLSLPALAQEPTPLDLPKVPQQGKTPQDFVPPGWKIEDTVRGDLDKNGSEDVVLQLVEAGPDSDSEGVALEHARALLVLLTDGATLRRAGASNQVLYCTTCAGTLSTPGATGQVKLQKGVLLIEQSSGSREMTHSLLRFRFEPKDKRFLLIGEDIEHVDRATGSTQKTSTNLLTGQQISEKLQFDEKKNKNVPLAIKKEKVPVKKVFLEDVNISKY